MKVEQSNGSTSRKVLIGMLTDRAVLGAVAAKWTESGLFGTDEENRIGRWAVRHYKKLGKPPMRSIEAYFDRWAETQQDKDRIGLTEKLMQSLSMEFQRRKIASEVLLDLAADVFNAAAVRELNDQTAAALRTGDVKKAAGLVRAFQDIEIGTGAGHDLFTSKEIWMDATKKIAETVIEWDQPALKLFFEGVFVRDAFVAFEGKEKVGKSFWLQEVAWQAVKQKRRVAFFEVGDQSLHQIVRRFGARAANRPFKADRRMRYPVKMAGTPPAVQHEDRAYDAPMTFDECAKAFTSARRAIGDPRALTLACYPNSTISVAGIENVLDEWARRSDWRPDVILIDYADILAPLNGSAETRDQINASWKAMRALSQKTHACLVTATQTDAASYKEDLLTRTNFSEDKRKHSHVTAMIGINQSDEEMEMGLMRLNVILGRDLEFSEKKCVYTAPCLGTANPAVLSSY